jgi:MerR family copper efflux transcriptional regulator
MQIGELAQQGGVTVQTVRFYERQGLLPEPRRKDSGYRIYSEEDVRRLAFIRQAKVLGFSLVPMKMDSDQIGQKVYLSAQGRAPVRG